MSFFDKVFHQLFPEKSARNEILLHEPIKRSTDYAENFSRWSKSFKRRDLLSSVYNSYELKQQGIIASPEVFILNSNTSNGFAIGYDSSMDTEEFSFLFDWLGEKTKQLNYKRVNSDVTVTAKSEEVQTVSKYYFKPRKNLQERDQKIDQQYGNILIEHILINDKPSYIRFIVNNYKDRQYKQAHEFEKLAEFLFSK